MCWKTSAPESLDWMRLKRLARYLIGDPRKRLWFEFQDYPSELVVWTESDHAGCTRTRRNTSEGVIQIGNTRTKTWSTTQAVVALSRGDAEYYGLVKVVGQFIDINNMMQDLGLNMKVVAYTVASVANIIATRKGVGKLRHVDANQLWVQEQSRADLSL